MNRSLRTDVRNPLLTLPAAQRIAGLPPGARAALRGLLREISADARERAEKAWRTHKAPMAAYWKAVAVYANHAQRLCKGQTTLCLHGEPVEQCSDCYAAADFAYDASREARVFGR